MFSCLTASAPPQPMGLSGHCSRDCKTHKVQDLSSLVFGKLAEPGPLGAGPGWHREALGAGARAQPQNQNVFWRENQQTPSWIKGQCLQFPIVFLARDGSCL